MKTAKRDKLELAISDAQANHPGWNDAVADMVRKAPKPPEPQPDEDTPDPGDAEWFEKNTNAHAGTVCLVLLAAFFVICSFVAIVAAIKYWINL